MQGMIGLTGINIMMFKKQNIGKLNGLLYELNEAYFIIYNQIQLLQDTSSIWSIHLPPDPSDPPPPPKGRFYQKIPLHFFPS